MHIQQTFSQKSLAFSFSITLLQLQGFLAYHGVTVVTSVLVLTPELAWLMIAKGLLGSAQLWTLEDVAQGCLDCR